MLAARSGTEFTWSPQLRKLAEWDWVPIFLQNKYGGECRHRRTMSFCSVLSFTASKHQEKVSMNFFNGIFGHQEAWRMNSSCLGDFNYHGSAPRQVQLLISFVNFRATSLVHFLYIFSPTVVLRTLFLSLNICYKLTILVWVLQQSYGNVH